MKYLTKFLFVLSLVLVLGCSKDFLDRTPESDVIPEQYLNEESQLASYAIGMYGILPTHENYNFGTFGIDADTDNMADLDYSDIYVPGQYKVPQNGGSWSFTNIYKCNYFLNRVVPEWKKGGINGSESGIKQYIVEMYFFRGYEYFQKVKAFGDFPIIKNTFRDDKKTLIEASKRAPSSEVVRFILSDLDSAATLMMPSSPDGGKNRLSRYCALLMKSRVALYEATWLKYFKNTAFVPNGPNWPGKTKSYNKDYNFKSGNIDSEIDWLLEQSMQASKKVAENYSLTPNNGVLKQSQSDLDNPYFSMFGDEDMSGYGEVMLWRDYDRGLGVVNTIPVYEQSGNFGVGLTKGMVDSYLMANGMPIYAAGSGYKGDDYISDVRADRDDRLRLFLKEPGQKNVLYNLGEGNRATPIEPIPDITNSAPGEAYSTGYAIRKGINYNGAQADNGQGSIGSIVFRATEAYLNYIEACYEKNHSLDSYASQYWKALRNRANVNPNYQSTISATDMQKEAKGDWGAYSAGQLVDPTLYNIRRERRSELMAEGLREMDLRRWRSMDQLIDNPYHIQGFKLWGPMQNWYDQGKLTYGSASANVSAPSLSHYLRPYEISGKELVYNGYRWAMAHYLDPIAIHHFLNSSQDGTVDGSPIYQNPDWPTKANQGAIK